MNDIIPFPSAKRTSLSAICAGCHSGCCRAHAIPITGADIFRITTQYQLSFWDIACRWEDSAGQIAGRQNPHFVFEDTGKTPFAICLLHAPSATFPNATKCRFLDEFAPTQEHPLGTARCGIYESRPLACRCFPAGLHVNGGLARADIPEFGRDSRDPAYKLCPPEISDFDLDELESQLDLSQAADELQFFRLVADLWNREPRPWAVFGEFLALVYQRVETRNAQVRRAA